MFLQTTIDLELLERIVEVISPYKDKTPIRLWMGPSLYIVIAEPRDIEVNKLFNYIITLI